MRAAICLAIVAAAALAVLASQQGGDGKGDGPLNAIAAAAERTQHEPGGRAAMRALATSPALPRPLTMSGRTAFDDEDRSRTVVTVPNPESDGQMRLEMVSEGEFIYLRSEQFGSLPGGREWMGLDLSSGQEPETPLPADMDAQGELEILRSASGRVQKLGREEVRGVPATRYRITEENDATALMIEVWIDDADKLVRRMRIVHPPSGDEGADSTRIDMRIDFFDFGIDPQIDVPDPDDVYDVTDLARARTE